MPEASSRLAVLAGSFDPLTNGHLDMLDRAIRLFDRVVLAVLINPGKTPLFSIDERVSMIRDAVGGRPAVEVDTFDGLLAEYVRRRGATAVVRGLRTAGEFSSELPTVRDRCASTAAGMPVCGSIRSRCTAIDAPTASFSQAGRRS
jgi:pantetheine-phosphate adenylyltransferase